MPRPDRLLSRSERPIQQVGALQRDLEEGALPGRLVVGSGGYGFIAATQDMVSRVKAGKAFMTLEENETPLPPIALADEPKRQCGASEAEKRAERQHVVEAGEGAANLFRW